MPAPITITYLIENTPPCDIEIMEQMGWEFIGIGEVKSKERAFFMANIEN